MCECDGCNNTVLVLENARLIAEVVKLRDENRKFKQQKRSEDTKRLDFLQQMSGKSQSTKIVCRWSGFNRGWRLHETEPRFGGCDDVRQAIDEFIETVCPYKVYKVECGEDNGTN